MGKRVPPPGSTSPSIVPSCPLLLLPPGAWLQPPLDFSPPVNLPLQLPLCSHPSSATWPLMLTPVVLFFASSVLTISLYTQTVISTQNSSFQLRPWSFAWASAGNTLTFLCPTTQEGLRHLL